MKYISTPDGRYFVVRGRLWRMTNPRLEPDEKTRLTKVLMENRRAVRSALTSANPDSVKEARQAVHATKVALGERGPAWWTDHAPDYNRRLVKNTPYAPWYQSICGSEQNA